MRAVFLDAVGLPALWSQADQWHHLAEQAFAEITRDRSILITTTFVLLECGNAVACRGSRDEVNRLRETFQRAGTLIWPTESDWEQAWQAYQRGEADAAGIVDHISFVVMRRLGITTAFTNDKHFRAAGLETMF